MYVNDELLRNIFHDSIKLALGKHEYVTTEHLLYSSLKYPEISEFLENLGEGTTAFLKKELENIFSNYIGSPKPMKFPSFKDSVCIPIITDKVIQVMEKILIKTLNSEDRSKIQGWRIIREILDSDTVSSELLKGYLNLDVKKLDEIIKEKFDLDESDTDGKSVNYSFSLEEAKEYILKYTTLLNNEIENMTPVIGREREIFEINKVLGRKTKNNVLLVGDAGVGKTAIIHGLAMKYENDEVPENSKLKGTKIYSLSMSSLMAGTKYRGELEERIDNLIKSFVVLSKKEKNMSILFIDEMHMLIGSGTSSDNRSMDIANLLKPALSNGKLRVIGATTTEEYRKYLEKDSAFSRRFHVIHVNEPSEEDCIEILKGIISHFEKHHNVKYEEESIVSAVKLSNKFIHKNKLPDKAIDVIDSAGSKNNLVKDRNDIITVDKIVEEVSYISKIPVSKIIEKKSDKIRNLKQNLSSKIFGQDHVLDTVVNAIYMAQAGLKESTKPDAIFMFNGPTGVGKTEVAKCLAENLDMNFVRIDMSEYMEKHTVSKLIGAPPGYVGFDSGSTGDGILINEVRENPFSVVLFDEVEKAHPDVWNILLQIMDYGHLTSSGGKKVNFSNTIIILTSNIGSRYVGKKEIGFARDEIGSEIQDEMVKSTLPPELINRIDHVVTFNHLQDDVIEMIANKFLKELESILTDKNIKMIVTPEAMKFLKKHGYSKEYGARPMKRVIDKHVKFKLAPMILFNEDEEKTITIDCENDEIILK